MFTERGDHSSDIMFVEQWAAANGYEGVHSKELTQWRRDHMSNLVNALDFDNVSSIQARKSTAFETRHRRLHAKRALML